MVWTCAVIPAFGEASMIRAVIDDVRAHVTKVVVVDDGSEDDTAAEARRAGAVVLRHAVNRGQGAALATGVSYALMHGSSAIVTFDADGQHQGSDIPRLLEPVLAGTADVALGSRFLSPAPRIPPLRRLVLKGAVLFTRLATGLPLTDAHNGLRAFSREAAQKIGIRQDRMAHASEILSEIKRHGLRFVEVPVDVRYTAYSRTKGQGVLSALRILLDLWVGRGVK